MSSDDDLDFRVVLAVLVPAIVVVVGIVLGVGIHQSRSSAGMETPKVVSAPAAAAPAAESHEASAAPEAESHEMDHATSADASVVIENGVVTFYFASGKADLAPGALDALGDAIAAAKNGKHLVLSGFHDATGNPAANAELAKKRALSVRDALVSAGVPESALELRKPEETTGSGNDAEARRVEVTIAD